MKLVFPCWDIHAGMHSNKVFIPRLILGVIRIWFEHIKRRLRMDRYVLEGYLMRDLLFLLHKIQFRNNTRVSPKSRFPCSENTLNQGLICNPFHSNRSIM